MSLVVLTGAAHAGKTTLLRALADRGHPVIEEAALGVIEGLRRERADAADWMRAHPAALQERISREQAAREAAADPAVTTFADRGLVDGLAYCRLRGHPPPEHLVAALRTARYAAVFLLEPILPFAGRPESGRIDDEAFARALHDELRAAWTAFGLPPVPLPAESVTARADRVLAHLGAA